MGGGFNINLNYYLVFWLIMTIYTEKKASQPAFNYRTGTHLDKVTV